MPKGTPTQVEMPKVHPPKSRHSQLQAATDPTDPTLDGTSGCHDQSRPVVVIFYLLSRLKAATERRCAAPRSGAVAACRGAGAMLFFTFFLFFLTSPGVWGGLSGARGGRFALKKSIFGQT